MRRTSPFRSLAILGSRIRGWLPKQPAEASPHGMSGPWWWMPAWAMGAWMAEAGVLNLIVPVSTLGLPLFLLNMWLCFAVGGYLGNLVGNRWVYRLLPPGLGRKARMLIALSAGIAELAIGIAYFSVSDWDYVLTNCQTGNACTFFQLAPVLFLILGVVVLAGLAILAVTGRIEGDE